jgi:AraC family transcriptional regulator
MGDLAISTTGKPIVSFAPPSILQRQTATWGAVQVESVEVLRHEPFEYQFTAFRHLLIASERVNRDDGETHVDGLPKSHLRAWNRKLTFIPAGHRFYGWQKPRSLSRGTHLYIDPHSPLLQLEPGCVKTQFRPRLFFFDRDLWETVLKLKAQAKNPGRSQLAYVEALSLVLAYELIRMNESVPAFDSRLRGGLPGWQQTKLTQYIDEHLAKNI